MCFKMKLFSMKLYHRASPHGEKACHAEFLVVLEENVHGYFNSCCSVTLDFNCTRYFVL